MKGFKEFILRGNVMDLAVAVVIGAAFTAIVGAVVTNIFTPLIGALFNAKDLAATGIVRIPLTSGVAELKFGAVLAAVITFLITALVVYFVFVVPMNALLKRAFQKPAEPVSDTPAPPTELDLLAQIRDLLEGQQRVGDKRILNQD
ncbi:large conductance mechanosensitive channel protein MscL [Amnibacterium kyonggiense]|uniref:Large-conductance mechanosensitive channel n=1 Tax=Amnibacterium kyonggiense TaxID=595671 RepID=A0A4R7FRH8_9MICO|nr:large conductance mechanosensitive channel protein MscL [Amnibacterium kyonggiense]TDS80435.1 large conductance mechanosensitive channel [Amnibacterium kyonggiense]